MPSAPLSPRDSRHYLGYARQVAKGTGLVPAFFATFVEALELDPGAQVRKIREAGGSLYPGRHVKDSYLPGVSFGAPIRPDEGAAMLAFLLGSAPAPSGAGPYTHTITADELTTWVSLERNIGDDQVERITDGFFMEATIDIRKRDQGPEPLIQITAGGLSVATVAAPTVESYEADLPFLRSDATWTLDSVGVTNVESCTIVLRWTFDEGLLADDLERSNAVKLGLDGTIDIVYLYEDDAAKDAYNLSHYDQAAAPATLSEFVYQGDLNIALDHSRGGVAENENRNLTIDIPAIDWTNAVIDSPDPEGSEAIRLRRTGEMMSNNNAPISVTAINDRSTAYIG